MTARRIVVVEDDDGVRQIIEMSLQGLGGYEVKAFASGAAAVAGAASFEPDLLMLDVSMPDMDGPATLAALREQAALKAVPAVFLTALTQAREVQHYRSLGVIDVLAKPFDPQQLCERIAAVFASTAAPVTDAARVALVVEDDPGVRYLLGFILGQNGYRVIEAEDGEQGWQALQHGELADVVLLDIMLPHRDGLQLLERMRALPRWNAVPAVMLTAQGDEKAVSRALALGADDYLGKPFDPNELVMRLQRLPARAG